MPNNRLTVEDFLASRECRMWLDRCATRIGFASFEQVFNVGMALAESGGASQEPVDGVRSAINDLRDWLNIAMVVS